MNMSSSCRENLAAKVHIFIKYLLLRLVILILLNAFDFDDVKNISDLR